MIILLRTAGLYPVGLALGLLLFSSALSAQTERFVAPGGNDGGNTCTNQAAPCATIGHALGQSDSGDRIRIAAGIYTERLTVDRSIELIGAGMQETIIQAAASPDTANGRVITVEDAEHSLSLRQLKLRHGFAASTSGVGSRGGAIFVPGSVLELEHVSMVANRANGRGGAIFNDGGTVSMSFADFRGNTAQSVGGAFQPGGAISNENGGVILAVNSWFRGNTAAVGGGIYSFGTTTEVDLTNVAVTGNLATERGGGVSNGAGILRITNAVFSANLVDAETGRGGGVETGGRDPHPEIRNSVFWNNRDGAGTGTDRSSISSSALSNPRIAHSLVQGCGGSGTDWNGDCGVDFGGNLPSQNPLFTDPIGPDSAPNATGRFRQLSSSPLINRGNNSFIAGIGLDLDGWARIIDGVVDIGPFEFGNDGLFRDRFEQ